MKSCGKVYENMLGEEIKCGSVRHDEQGVGIRYCRKCLESSQSQSKEKLK